MSKVENTHIHDVAGYMAVKVVEAMHVLAIGGNTEQAIEKLSEARITYENYMRSPSYISEKA